MNILFDTSSLIELERDNILAERVMKKHLNDTMLISVITLSEFHVGALLSKKPQAKLLAKAFLAQFIWKPVSDVVAIKTAEYIVKNKKEGKRIHFQDAIIAATGQTLAVDVLITENKKDFSYLDIPVKTILELIS